MHTDQPQIAVDPNLAPEQAAAQKTLIDNLQVQAQGDTASLMARYGISAEAIVQTIRTAIATL